MVQISHGRSGKQDPSIALYGVGSRQMQEAGVRMLADASEISVVGITEVLTHIRAIYRVYSSIEAFSETGASRSPRSYRLS